MWNARTVASGQSRAQPRRCILAAILFMAYTVTAHAADPTVIAQDGDWQAFKSDDSCSIGIGSDSAFALMYFVQEDAFALDITSPIQWRFSGGTNPAIRVATDGHRVLSKDDGALKYNVLQFVLSREEATELLQKMADSSRLQVVFPNGNRDGGFINLNGARSTISAFLHCSEHTSGRADAVGSSPPSSAPTFTMTFNEFRKSLDAKIREDTPDKSGTDFSTTNHCRKVVDGYICDFHDSGFQSTVVNFKKLDVMNGSYSLKLTMVVDTSGDKVTSVTLNGDKSDIVNLMQFNSIVEEIMKTFDPAEGQQAGGPLKIADELGIMRGNDAPDIGDARSLIRPYAEITCISRDSHVSTEVECQFVPRS